MDDLTRNNATVAYYYCDYADHSTLLFSTFLGTITKQLLERFVDIPMDIEERIQNGCKSPDNGDMTEILLSVLRNFARVYLVIDGIDELPIADQRAICLISEKFEDFTDVEIKLFISSRTNTLIMKPLRGFRIELSVTNISSDIECFIRARVRSSLDSAELKIRNPALEEEIVRALQEGAKGLYACQTPHECDI